MQQRNQRFPGARLSTRSLLAVAVGGFFGATARILIAILLPDNPVFPATTLTVNVVGTAALGFFGVYFAVHPRLAAWWRAGIGTGFLGAFTTFSTLVIFMLGTSLGIAVLYAGVSFALCAFAAWLTMVLTERHYRVADHATHTGPHDSNISQPERDRGDGS